MQGGKLLAWDATCPDTFAPPHSSLTTLAAGEVAAQAEESKYQRLPDSFTPVATETTGRLYSLDWTVDWTTGLDFDLHILHFG